MGRRRRTQPARQAKTLNILVAGTGREGDGREAAISRVTERGATATISDEGNDDCEGGVVCELHSLTSEEEEIEEQFFRRMSDEYYREAKDMANSLIRKRRITEDRFNSLRRIRQRRAERDRPLRSILADIQTQLTNGLERFESRMNARMDRLEVRMDGLESRMDGLESRMDEFEASMVRNQTENEKLQAHIRNLVLSLSKRDIEKVPFSQSENGETQSLPEVRADLAALSADDVQRYTQAYGLPLNATIDEQRKAIDDFIKSCIRFVVNQAP